MTDSGSRAFLLSEHELFILLCKREADGLILPDEIAEITADEAQLKNAMGELITDKYLLPGNDGLYCTSPPIEQIVEIMTGASFTYVLEEMQNKFAPCYLYRVNLEAVLLYMDVHHKGWVRLEYVRLEDKLKELLSFPLSKIQVQRFKTGDPEPDKVMIITDDSSFDEALDKILEA